MVLQVIITWLWPKYFVLKVGYGTIFLNLEMWHNYSLNESDAWPSWQDFVTKKNNFMSSAYLFQSE